MEQWCSHVKEDVVRELDVLLFSQLFFYAFVMAQSFQTLSLRAANFTKIFSRCPNISCIHFPAVIFTSPSLAFISLLLSLLLLVVGCADIKCNFYSTCVERPDGQAACVCNERCDLKLDLVCGSNGKTYINECLLRADACKQRKSFVVLQKGACSKLREACV